jgi:hypothetical protein
MSGPTANDYVFTKDDKVVEEKWREFFEKNKKKEEDEEHSE